MGVKVITDSTSYIKDEIKKELDIRIVSLSVSFDNESYKETEIPDDKFYELMDKKGIPTSSQPALGEIYNEMKSIVAEGDSVLGVFLSSEMSGTYKSACLAKDMILQEFKDAEIEIIDSRSNCMQLGFAAITAARGAIEGKTLAEIKLDVEANVRRSRFLFIPANLEYLRKGGRIGGAGALLGNLLKIIPILTVENGITSVLTKVRTKKNAIQTMLNKVFTDISEHGLGEIGIHHINCPGEAKELAEKIKGKLEVEVDIHDIGPVIGLHVGPGALGIVYYTQKNLR